MLDGFIDGDEKLKNGMEENIHYYRNQVSPFSDIEKMKGTANGRVFIDTFYGLAYDSWIEKENLAIYGKTNELPEYSGDSLVNMGFLRVPFRRIPRRLVKGRLELEAIVNSLRSEDPNLTLLFRGQNKEYLLNRSPETLFSLYGDSQVLEPSLLPSATRRGVYLEDILPAWCALIQIFMKIHLHDIRSWMSESTFNSIVNEFIKLTNSYEFGLFALALAQHYGLPSAGLDLTDKLDIALFFALRRFSPVHDSHYVYAFHDSQKQFERPVIYLFSPHFKKRLIFYKFRPKGFPLLRPDKQSAHFLHTGWGLNKNDAARYLFVALYLDPTLDYGPIPSITELFPITDEFARVLHQAKSNLKLTSKLKQFLDYLYLIG